MASRGSTPIHDLPDALSAMDRISDRVGDALPVVFLDYDGTLTPIVDDPDQALLPDQTRHAMERLRDECPVAVVSGRDLDEVREMVGLDGIHYVGSHGFEILEADGTRHGRAEEYLPALDRGGAMLEEALGDVPGARVERKRFAVAVHYRTLEDPGDEQTVREAVNRVVARESGLKQTGGKKILELRPDVEWDKGKAVLWLLDLMDTGGRDLVPFYLGDDLTDEDAFQALRDRGVGIVVAGEEDRETRAHYCLEDPTAVRRFLGMLAELVRTTGSA